MAVWLSSGSPLYPNKTEIAAEIDASELIEIPISLSSTGPGVVIAIISLEPWAVARGRFALMS
jgi:hypothetical protein